MTPPSRRPGTIAIAGGAGFIGSNLAASYLADGHEVLVIDNLSRPGVTRNLGWLKAQGGSRLHFLRADIADAEKLAPALEGVSALFHFAAQTAVTTSLEDPRADFSTNALGTLNLLETIRQSGADVPVIYASTNKVYGALDTLTVSEFGNRYLADNREAAEFGIPETAPLAFATPYGCSKGVADQYVLDYARSYGLRTAVLRMSCVYGPRQFGTEDQGWVAHFALKALMGEPVTLFGDGRQVRDVLYVGDAVAAYRTVLAGIDRLSGEAFNLGGGPENAVSLLEVLEELAAITGQPIDIGYGDWRAGDQPYFVADTRKLTAATGWRADTNWRDGLALLVDWLVEGGLARRPRVSA